MTTQVNKDLDPKLETLGLLMCSRYNGRVQQWIEEQMSQRGIDALAFYPKCAKVYEKYIRVFTQHLHAAPGDGFFLEGGLNNCFMAAIIHLSGYFSHEKLEQMCPIDRAAQLASIYNECFESDLPFSVDGGSEEMFRFVEATELDDNEKWKFLLLMQNPLKYLDLIEDMVQRNRKNYEKARAAVAAPLEKLLARFRESPEQILSDLLIREDIQQVSPTLALPFSQIVVQPSAYIGLYWQEFCGAEADGRDERKRLAMLFKLLGDKSKLEILFLLRDRPWYSLELAKRLSLTPATVSYHMEALLACGLIKLEHSEKRIYYTLKSETVEWMREELKGLL